MPRTMPRIGNDPFQAASDYERQSNAIGARREQNAQNALMRLFATEAARQQPWSDLPVNLAKQNNAARNNLRNAERTIDYKNKNKPSPSASKVNDAIGKSAQAQGIDPLIPQSIAYVSGQSYSNIDDAVHKMKDTEQELQSAGIPVDVGTIYLAQQQGIDGAKALLSNPDAKAVDIVGRQAVLANGGRLGMSAKTFTEMWMGKARKEYAKRKELGEGDSQRLYNIDGRWFRLGDD